MATHIEDHLTEPATWKRGLWMLFFLICLYVAGFVFAAVVIFQFLLKLVTGRTNKRLLDLGQGLSTYIYRILEYLSFNSDQNPFPFADWKSAPPPVAKGAGPSPEVASGQETTARKTAPAGKKTRKKKSG